MKKVLLFAVVVAGLGFTSCSKSDCECTVNGETTTVSGDKYEGEGDWKDSCNDVEGCKAV